MTRTVFRETEAQFQSAVIGLARFHGWRVAHFRPAMNAKGRWRTPVQADGAGFPDLVMVRQPRLIFVELKTDKGRIGTAQVEWLQALALCNVESAVWRPKDWALIEKTLARSTGAAGRFEGEQDELRHEDWE